MLALQALSLLTNCGREYIVRSSIIMDKVTKVVAFLLLLHLHGAWAREHVAGDQLGWYVSRLEGAPSFYQDWATRSSPFLVGDTIRKYPHTMPL